MQLAIAAGVLVLTILAAGLWALASDEAPPSVTVYKSPDCHCCELWMRHMRASGFAVEPGPMSEWASVRKEYGIEPAAQACHTAVVDGLVIEGHVPAADVRRLLAKPRSAAGLVLPGMPRGSPGMESATPETYTVLAIDRAGRLSPFRKHEPPHH